MYLTNINLITEKSLKYTSISNEVNKIGVIMFCHKNNIYIL